MCNSQCFPDLIRHGKHHNQNVTNHPKQVESSPPTSMTPVPSHPITSPSPREAAQIIVDEERQAHLKMPKYQGLENFELLDKMGESVVHQSIIRSILLTRFQRCLLQCIQGNRPMHFDESRRYLLAVPLLRATLTCIRCSQSCAQIRAQCVTGQCIVVIANRLWPYEWTLT